MSRRDMDRHIGAKIVAVWGIEELELAADILRWAEAEGLRRPLVIFGATVTVIKEQS